jgi:hypothetical protein
MRVKDITVRFEDSKGAVWMPECVEELFSWEIEALGLRMVPIED